MLLRTALWLIPLGLAIFFFAVSLKLRVLYYKGPPSAEKLYEYIEAHQGRYPPLPNPIRATYLIFDQQGLSYFDQSGTMVPQPAPDPFLFYGTLPGRFQMLYVPGGYGIRSLIYEELVDMRDMSGTLGFVWRTISLTPHSAPFSCKQITVPRWFFIALGVAPSLIIAFRSAKLRTRINRRLRNQLCPSCGYDLRATPNRCPECGTIPADVDMMLVNAHD